jgi:hypothetical protein
MEYYWDLTLRDGTVISVKPSSVSTINTRIANGLDIATPTRTIIRGEVQSFKMTDRPFNTQPLLESAAQAFNEAVFSDDGGVVFRWVKRGVPHDQWARNYSHIPAYRMVNNDGSMVEMAYKLPAHQVDPRCVSYCSDAEINKLERG